MSKPKKRKRLKLDSSWRPKHARQKSNKKISKEKENNSNTESVLHLLDVAASPAKRVAVVHTLKSPPSFKSERSNNLTPSKYKHSTPTKGPHTSSVTTTTPTQTTLLPTRLIECDDGVVRFFMSKQSQKKKSLVLSTPNEWVKKESSISKASFDAIIDKEITQTSIKLAKDPIKRRVQKGGAKRIPSQDKVMNLSARGALRKAELVYDPFLMSTLPKNGIPKNGEIYLEKKDDKLDYIVKTPSGDIVNDTLDINVPTLTLKTLRSLRSQIIEETSKRNHTPKIDIPPRSAHWLHFISHDFIGDESQKPENLGLGLKWANGAMELINREVSRLLHHKDEALRPTSLYLSVIPEWVEDFKAIRLLKSITIEVKNKPGKEATKSVKINFDALSFENIRVNEIELIRGLMDKKFLLKPAQPSDAVDFFEHVEPEQAPAVTFSTPLRATPPSPQKQIFSSENITPPNTSEALPKQRRLQF